MSEKKNRRKFTKEFKEEVVLQILTEGRSQAEISREIGVHANTIGNWVRQYEANSSEAFPGNGNRTSLEEENRRLKRELASAKEDRDILKKALAFFSKNSK
ncbi:MAG: transposase [Calditrichota bacterium]